MTDLSSIDPATRPVIQAVIAQLEQTIGAIETKVLLPYVYFSVSARSGNVYVDRAMVQYTVFNPEGFPLRFVALRSVSDVHAASLEGLTDCLRGVNQPDWSRLIAESQARRHPRNALSAEASIALETIERLVGRLIDYTEVVENREVRWITSAGTVPLRFTKDRVSFDFEAESEALANPALKDRGVSASGEGYRRIELSFTKVSDATQSAAELIADAMR